MKSSTQILTNATLIIVFTILLNGSLVAAEPGENTPGVKYRESILINDHWSYLEEDIANVADLKTARASWTSAELPHTWNRDDVMDVVPGYRRGVGWYRRGVTVPAGKDADRYILYFEGVNMKADVFVNGKQAGGHVGGYLGFEIDITAFLKRGSANTFHVKVDNSVDPDVIPSQKSDFFLYGGIVRNVWLKRVPASYLSGLKVKTSQVSREKAGTQIEVAIVNTTDKPVNAILDVSIVDNSRVNVAQSSSEARIDREIGRAHV